MYLACIRPWVQSPLKEGRRKGGREKGEEGGRKEGEEEGRGRRRKKEKITG
jgi:hypothetical protein